MAHVGDTEDPSGKFALAFVNDEAALFEAVVHTGVGHTFWEKQRRECVRLVCCR